MTYFLKDCGREVSPPAKERDDIARAAAETFATRPYIRFALFIEPYADGSGDDSVELIAVPDRRFGVPLVPWAATGCGMHKSEFLRSAAIEKAEKILRSA